MYSLILMSALAAPGQDPVAVVPAGPVVFGCGGCTSYSCTGCCGYSYSCGGCCGYSYKHCIFGLHAGCHGLFGHRTACSGCCGYTYSCCGGCCGGWAWGSCCGYSYSCCGGCCGGVLWGGPVYYSPSAVYGTVTNMNPPEAPAPATPAVTGKDGKQGAKIKFQLPADAKLYVDGRLTNLTGTERSFATPALGAGKFFYEVKAELMVEGAAVVEQKRVVVEAGVAVVESFPKLFAAIERKGDAVAGK